MIASQMLRSKTHEVGIVLFGTAVTENRLHDSASATSSGHGPTGYENMVEFMNVRRPSALDLRRLERLKDRGGYWGADFPEDEFNESEIIQGKDDDEMGDAEYAKIEAMASAMYPSARESGAIAMKPKSIINVSPPDQLSVACDCLRGLILSADLLYRATNKKRYNRRIIMLTDGASPIEEVRAGELSIAVNGLLNMNTSVDVIGMEFKDPSVLSQVPIQEEEDDDSEGYNSDDSSSESSSCGPSAAEIKVENERTLHSIVAKTSGHTMPCNSLLTMLRVAGSKRIPRSTKTAMSLTLGPNLSVEATFSLGVSKANLSTLRTHAVVVDEDVHEGGVAEVMKEVTRDTSYRDSVNPEIEVDPSYRSCAYRYGGTYIPTNAYDELSLKMEGPVQMKILGYVNVDSVPIAAMIDSGYVIEGSQNSSKARIAISALAQALHNDEKVAVSRFVKKVDADPVMGVMMPYKGKAGEEEDPHRLVFVQMPFNEDFAKHTFRSIMVGETTPEMNDAAENLVDAMMLKDDDLVSVLTPNPGIRNLNRTLIRRCVEGKKSKDLFVDCRSEGDVRIEIPQYLLQNAQEAIANFKRACPVKEEEPKSKRRFGKSTYWSDALEQSKVEEKLASTSST